MDRKTACYQLWLHYNKIKDDYHLYYCDIFRQINFDYNDSHIKYLSIHGGGVLSQRQGTFGKALYEVLSEHQIKTDWFPSTATYEDKLNELLIIKQYEMSIIFLEKEPPTLKVGVCSFYNKKTLTDLLTIDGVVPRIKEIVYFEKL